MSFCKPALRESGILLFLAGVVAVLLVSALSYVFVRWIAYKLLRTRCVTEDSRSWLALCTYNGLLFFLVICPVAVVELCTRPQGLLGTFVPEMGWYQDHGLALLAGEHRWEPGEAVAMNDERKSDVEAQSASEQDRVDPDLKPGHDATADKPHENVQQAGSTPEESPVGDDLTRGTGDGEALRTVEVVPSVGQYWAILVGPADYAVVRKLKYCGQDVRDMRDRLAALGFADDHIFVLHDTADDPKYLPSKANVEEQVDLLLGKPDSKTIGQSGSGLVKSGDWLVVVLSGHGVQLDGKSYFCPSDARLDKPETLVSLDRLYGQLKSCPAQMKLLVVDACRNDPRPEGIRSASSTAEVKAFAQSLVAPKGVIMLTSCTADQVSVEDEKLEHGVFMHFVLKGLEGAADADGGNRNGHVSLFEIFNYARDKTELHVARTRSLSQTPELKGETAKDFEFALRGTGKEENEVSGPPKPPPTKQTEGGGVSSNLITNSIGMKLALIPAGDFTMGSPESEEGRETNECQHLVQISRSFYMGAYEVTQKQYVQIMQENPSYFPASSYSDFPVDSVEWIEAGEFCRRLSELPEEKKTGRKYRLPTEAEWEYACRAETTTPYNTGLVLRGTDVELHSESLYKVGQYPPNAWGLHDMHGNASEWCADRYEEDFYRSSPLADPAAPSGTTRDRHVVRGGGDPIRQYTTTDERSAARSWGDSGRSLSSHKRGFRVVCECASSNTVLRPPVAAEKPKPAEPASTRPGSIGKVETAAPVPPQSRKEPSTAEGGLAPNIITNSIDMKLALIPADQFIMGSPDSDTAADYNEKPQHEVQISKPFYLGVDEVTQAEYQQVMNDNPSCFSVNGRCKQMVAGVDTSRFPVENVTWHDAVEFCRVLSARQEERHRRYVYRLPTEAEWECACRARTFTRYHFGHRLDSKWANFEASGLRRPTIVGSYRANDFGLHDMHGNVAEWCSDHVYSGSLNCVRGGDWYHDADDCRSASRKDNSSSSGSDWVGFRLALDPPGK